MGIAENLAKIKSKIPEHVKLVVVTKKQDVQNVLKAFKCGHRFFAENKAQEIIAKQPLLPKEIEWHFIGHLQTNKVKYIVPFVKLIHSVESLKLLKEINKEALKNNRVVDCLLQFYIAQEETKYGLSLEESEAILNTEDYKLMQNIRICGVMGMASFTDDVKQVKKEFASLKTIFDTLKTKYFSENDAFKELSMGMSDDYPIAVEQGSTILRVGSAVFAGNN